ncbi:MAG TPA: phosphoribosylanthranilate isomerase [Thermoanaerobaculia bacterium]|jgi:phosphoribosylanthranilate isomerase
MTKVKICGITRLEDAQACADLGADFLGFIFVRSSPRYIEPERAAEIVSQVRGPKFVGVFADELTPVEGLDYVQLHGGETDDDVRAAGLPAIKALRVGDVLPDTTAHPSAAWLLFDTGGGTGRRFDWSLLAMYPRTQPFFLAGGLTPDNVGAAISLVRPDAIDLASGVESAPGVKDHRKLRTLFERVRKP